MSEPLTVDLFGLFCAIVADDAELGSYLAHCYSDLVTARSPQRTVWLSRSEAGIRVAADDDAGRVASKGAAVQALSGELMRLATDYAGRSSTVTHCALVGKGGHSMLIAAKSGSGKSTLTTGLVRAGWDYFTDELVAVDAESGRLAALRRPIGLKPGAWHLFEDVRPDPALCGGYASEVWHVPATVFDPAAHRAEPVRPSVILFPSYDPSAPSDELHPVSRARAVQHLLEHSFHGEITGQRRLETLADLVADTDCFEVATADLAGAVAAAEQALGLKTTEIAAEKTMV